MAAMVTPKGTPSPTPIFVDDARPSEVDGRLGCDEGTPVDVMVGAADKEVVAVKSALEVINAMTSIVFVS